MLRIEHYTKRFGDTVAVHDLSLHIAPGEIYGFIGHNGAGKTTTLKACAGILSPDEGEIYINGLSIRENPLAVKKIIAYLPDNPELYPSPVSSICNSSRTCSRSLPTSGASGSPLLPRNSNSRERSRNRSPATRTV